MGSSERALNLAAIKPRATSLSDSYTSDRCSSSVHCLPLAIKTSKSGGGEEQESLHLGKGRSRYTVGSPNERYSSGTRRSHGRQFHGCVQSGYVPRPGTPPLLQDTLSKSLSCDYVECDKKVQHLRSNLASILSPITPRRRHIYNPRKAEKGHA